MKESIRKEIRNILKEELGVQLETKRLSSILTAHIIEKMKFYENNDNTNSKVELMIPFPQKIDSHTIEKTKIENIKIRVSAVQGEQNKASGTFKSKKTTMLENGFLVEIELSVEFKDSVQDVENEINSVINHELHHAFVFVQKYNKSQSPVNTINRAMMLEFFDKPALIRFLKMIYLTIPEEMQARVQEAGALLDKLEVSNYHDAIRELYRFQPINDASKMMKYNVDEVLALDDALLERFIESFFANLNVFGSKKSISKNPELFFRHFLGEIRTKGIELNKKIMKLVAQKFNREDKLLKEGKDADWRHLMAYLSQDGDLFEDIFGFDWS